MKSFNVENEELEEPFWFLSALIVQLTVYSANENIQSVVVILNKAKAQFKRRTLHLPNLRHM